MSDYDDGFKAAEDGRHCNDACPFFFSAVGVDQITFEIEYRARLNAWMQGWLDNPKHTLTLTPLVRRAHRRTALDLGGATVFMRERPDGSIEFSGS